MNILIIGGTRFLGAATARELLRRDHRVTVLHRGQTQGELPGEVTHVLCDRGDRPAIQRLFAEGRYDAVIDTILQAEDLEWYLPLAQRHTGQFLHCGSTGVYAPMASIPAREDDPTPCPEELGGFGAKLHQDEVLLDFHGKTGFWVCSLRVSNVFGAGDVPLEYWGGRDPELYQRMADNEDIWIPNDGRVLLQPVHVKDLARGFCEALTCAKAGGQIYNLSSGRAVTLTEYIRLGMELLGSRSKVCYVSIEDILAKGKANKGGLLFVCEHMSIDSGKAHRDFGYTPRIGVREGLRDSLQWMVRKGLLRATVRE